MKRIYAKDIVSKTIVELGLANIITENAKQNIIIREFLAGETVINTQDEMNALSIVVSGSLKIVPESIDGKSAIIEYVKKGDILGDIEYFCNSCCVHTVTADKKTTVLDIPYEIINKELKDYAPFIFFIARTLANKLIDSSKVHSQHLLLSLKPQLCKYILNEVEDKGTQTIKVKTIELAQKFGCSDRHLRRIFSELVQEGVILKARRGEITVVDLDTLYEKIC